MKKILILIIFLFLMTGCNINYNLHITSDFKFQENIEVRDSIFNYYPAMSEKYLSSIVEQYMQNQDNYKIVNQSVGKENYNVEVETIAKNLKEFNDLSSIGYLYRDKNIYINENNMIVFDLKSGLCVEEACQTIEFENIEVHVISDNEIINSNAEKINGKEYIWYLKDSVIEDIYFEIENKKTINYLYLIGIVVFVILVTLLGLLKKNKKVNEI